MMPKQCLQVPSSSIVVPLDVAVRLNSADKEIIQLICKGKASTVSELSEQVGRDLGNISRSVDKLEELGVLESYKSASDARVKNLEISEKYQ